jgi:oxygen-independent coproporphyrinogen-3 oxidase
MEWVGNQSHADAQIDTIFFGGGTPSLLSLDQFEEIFRRMRHAFNVLPDAEITIEANPGTVTREYLKGLADLGVNRISFGMQSANLQDLTMLNRQHKFEDVVNAVLWSEQAGIKHINLDLIFGIPGQSLQSWQTTLELASSFRIDHISLYSLIIEDGTAFKRWYEHGLLPEIEEETVAEMYELANSVLSARGFYQYEISNWAKRREDGLDARCQHNLHTWQYHPYFGFGTGASGFIDGVRTTNVPSIPNYINHIKAAESSWPAADSTSDLDLWEQMQEFMMIGLRLTDEGVSQADFFARFGMPMDAAFTKQLNLLLRQGLIEHHPQVEDRLRLTPQGRILGNQVFMQFVGNAKPKVLP